jgi:hypothetical protein
MMAMLGFYRHLGLGLSLGLSLGNPAISQPIAQLNPPVTQSGPDAGTTPDLRLPATSGAGTCRSGKNCPPVGIRFKPGQRIKVQILNRTDRPISIEKVSGSQPLILQGKQQISFYQGGGNSDNPSVVFWERNETPVRVKLSQPKPDTLFIDLSFAAKKPGDQSVYVRNDGRVDVF